MGPRSKLEEQLRDYAQAYDRELGATADLERRILAGTVNTPRIARQVPSLRREVALAALLILFVALVAIGIGKLRLLQQPIPARPSASLRIDPDGGVVTMVSTTTGWAIMDASILRTTDGGSHWRVVNSAAVLRGVPSYAHPYFLDDSHAWFMSPGAQETQITRTSDGGRTWQKGTAFSPAVDLAFSIERQNVVESELYFVDPQHGWLLLRSKVGWICPPKSPLPTPTTGPLCSGPLAGPYSAAIYGTSDGGDHWSLLAESLGSGSANQVLGLDCREVGLRFDKAGTGWLGFNCVQDQRVGPIIGITHDGGRNWQAIRLPYTPTGDGPWAQMTWPIFLADGKGLVQLDYPGILFATADGGGTWTPHPLSCTAIPPTNACASGGRADFIDPANGWLSALDGLYRTTNAGKTWTLISPRAGEPIQTQFLDANNGFGLKIVSGGTVTPPCTHCGDTLIYQIQKTTDGGHSWTVVQPMVQGP
jgi:photosystem II stability/assembly factor-like uncharacterized protein